MDRTKLTDILRITRKAKKHRQQDVARWAGLTQSELSNIENGQVDIRISTLKRIADALDLKIIAVPKDRLMEIENLIEPRPYGQAAPTLLEQYGVSDEDE